MGGGEYAIFKQIKEAGGKLKKGKKVKSLFLGNV
ncbi:hypothetical protein MUN87_11590 [Gracilibacillus salinarum]|uniref:Uncharacterized protein n=1 Tax=Gracilibacillus salinarum TaxID=2932255 RepID=A0ABY4GTF2_9BACI|nr:hypothetical protein [Gracilibacillus salinarum]UOQ87494.1 hypothetical protein MUN87_11590 [Gracilibacillus salinarum]